MAPAREKDRTASAPGANGTAEVLVVAESPAETGRLAGLLEAAGYVVRTAADGRAALAAARTRPPALVIGDAVMAGLDGYGMCRALKKEAALKTVPVLLLTSMSDPQEVIRGLDCGVDGIVRKPYEPRHLIARAESLVTDAGSRRKRRTRATSGAGKGERSLRATGGRSQLRNHLVATYEQAVQLNAELGQREKQLARGNDVLRGLYRIADGINTAASVSEIAANALEHAMELPGVRAGWISLSDGAGNFELVAARNLPPALTVPGSFDGSCTCRRMLLAGELEVVTDMLECERLARAPGGTRGMEAHVSVPIRTGDEALGVMNLVGGEAGLFDEADAPILLSVGDQLGVAFARARLHEGLERVVEERTASLASEVERRIRAQEEQARLVAILEATPDLVGTATPHGELLYLNRAGRRMIGVAEDADVASIRIAETHPEWAAKLVFEEGFPRALQEGVWSAETALRRHDGSEIPVLQVIVAHKGEGGHVEYLSTVMRDITARKRLEVALLEREAALDHAQRLTRLAHLVARADGSVESWSETMAQIPGHDSERAPPGLREWLDHVVHPGDRDRLRAAFRDSAARGLHVDEQYRVRARDGGWAWLRHVSEPAASSASSDGEPRWLVTLQDVTAGKRSEEEVRLLLAVTDDISSAADVQAALEAALKTICEATGWDCGEAWLRDSGLPRAFAVWHVADPTIERFARRWKQRRFAVDTTGSLVANTWRRREQTWIPDLAEATETVYFLRRSDALAAGLRAVLAVAVPGHDGQPLAALVFLRREAGAEDERMVRLIAGVARQLGAAIERKRAADRLAANEALLRKVLDTLPVGVGVADRAGSIQMSNPALAAIWGAGRRTVRRREGWRADGTPVGTGEWPIERAVRSGRPVLNEAIDILCADGACKSIVSSGAPIVDGAGAVTGGVEVTEDVSERRAQEHRIARLTRVHAMLGGINATIVRVKSRDELFDAACRLAIETGGFLFVHIRMISPDGTALLPGAYAGPEALRFVHIDARENAPPTIGALTYRTGRVYAWNDLAADQERTPMRVEALRAGCAALAGLPLRVGDAVLGSIVIGSREKNAFDDEEMRLLEELAGDVGFALDHLAKEARINYLALYDSLTGLANRTLFQDRIAQLARAGRGFAVATLNLVGFRRVNETFGMHGGDALLKRVAARLAEHSFNENVGRIGSNIFGALRESINDGAAIARWVESLRTALTQPYDVDGDELRLDVRIGVATFPSDGADAAELFANSETALERARKGGEAFVAYRPELNARVAERLMLENRLRRAVEQRQFVLHYQPKLDLRSGDIVGAEALIRWQDPEEGLISPGRFIPLLEETGLILEVGRWALETASAACAAWRAAGLACPDIAVNVSQIQMRRPDFAESVIAAIAAGGGVGTVSLEITETLIMESVEDSIAKLRKLRKAGVAVAVDDFGTGYSSLAYLSKLPIDALKIDRSFVVEMPRDPNTMTLVSTIISLANAYRLTAVAEGVDSEEQLELLRQAGCEQAQGYLFHKPLPPQSFEALLRGIPPA